MASHIPRDLGVPFDPAVPVQLAEFEGFGTDVPTTADLITAVQNPLLVRSPAIVRAARMFRPALVSSVQNPNGRFPTPDEIISSQTKTFSRSGRRRVDVAIPNVGTVDAWSFKDDFGTGADVWPAPTIRLKEGDLVHSIMSNSHGAHTIHHHGIEPTAMNDGVGHLTFEVGNNVQDGGANYVYQWKASEAGTYFYHCHRNTVLHFELGMYGMLIIDPAIPGAPFTDGGAGAIYLGNTATSYDIEAIWVADDIDSRWRDLDKSAGIAPPGVDANGQPIFMAWDDLDNPRLNDFDPNGFVVSGVAANPAQNNEIAAMGKTVTAGQKLLVRALNASYCTTVWKFPSTLQGTVTAVDARTLGRSSNGFGSYSEPYSLASINHAFTLTTAQRWDILIDTASATRFGTHMVEIEFRHWITNNTLYTVRLPIIVASSPG